MDRGRPVMSVYERRLVEMSYDFLNPCFEHNITYE